MIDHSKGLMILVELIQNLETEKMDLEEKITEIMAMLIN